MARQCQSGQLPTALNAEAVMSALRESPEGLSAHDLADLLNLSRSERKSLTTLLNRLQGAGLLRRYGQDFRWSYSRRALVGTIRQRRRKIINFIPDEIEERARGRIRIEPEETGGAFDGDLVVVSVARQQRGRDREAKVEMILRRGRLKIVGRLQRAFRQVWAESLDEKFPYEIDVEASDADEEGEIVVVEVTGYPIAGGNPSGRILEHLGASSDEAGMDIQIVIHK